MQEKGLADKDDSPSDVSLPLAGMIVLVALPKAIWDMARSPQGLHDADVILVCLAALTAMFCLLAELIVAQRRVQVGP